MKEKQHARKSPIPPALQLAQGVTPLSVIGDSISEMLRRPTAMNTDSIFAFDHPFFDQC